MNSATYVPSKVHLKPLIKSLRIGHFRGNEQFKIIFCLKISAILLIGAGKH